MDPSDSRYSPMRFRLLIRTGCCSSNTTVSGLQHWTDYLPLHAAPATPGDRADRFRSPNPCATAFPIWPQGRHLRI